MTRNSKIVLGIAAAAAIGAGIGILLTTEKGSEIRGRIRGVANRLVTDLLETINKNNENYPDSIDDREDLTKKLN